jgi:NAD(P)H dehydrogenase subunit S
MDGVLLPGSLVTVADSSSIYRGYRGIVQRLSGGQAAVLFEGGCWDKLITFHVSSLKVCKS